MDDFKEYVSITMPDGSVLVGTKEVLWRLEIACLEASWYRESIDCEYTAKAFRQLRSAMYDKLSKEG